MYERTMLIDAICGRTPAIGGGLMNDLQMSAVGYWTGGHVDRWTWHRASLEKLNYETLQNLYNLLRAEDFINTPMWNETTEQ